MKRKIVFFQILLFTCLFRIEGIGQIGDSIKIDGISKWMKWENKPQRFSINKSNITIFSGEKTDMYRDPNVKYNTDNAPKLLFDADANFVLKASVEHAFLNKWDGGALVLKLDSLNWVKCCFEKDYTGAKRIVTVVTKDISDDCNSVEIKSNKVYFKIAKADDVITIYYSENGLKWFLVRHFTFDTSKNLKIGFLSQSPTGKNCKVTFSDIQYTVKKIKDPYLGE